ncbi:FAD-binding protein [Nocardioides sp. MAHUQ-72]|uniref:FAD-binding protein n=1 Tax=unclassified Nocardioides TaxID=2615069 RepID=UPI003612B89A
MSEHRALSGWGGTAPTVAEVVSAEPGGVPAVVRAAGPRGLIARGLGRSYGDPAQNAGGAVLLPVTGPVEVDAGAGAVVAAAGTSLHDLMTALLPHGRFLPVTPGTRYVTVGGAIACDVHGKSHHVVGSIGRHVDWLELVTADGETRRIGPDTDPDLFWATVGGMGLTGVITRAALRTIPVETSYVSVTTTRLPDLRATMAAMRETDADHTYSVAWIDTLARGRRLGRSVLSQGEHATRDQLGGAAARQPLATPRGPRLAAPRHLPGGLVRPVTVRAFNELWFRKAPAHRTGEIQSLSTFFHPLDGVGGWNHLYGPRGFVQYQCVVPDGAEDVMARILERITEQGHASFLSVLKRFGPGNPGLLSFPMAGWTVALDLPAHPALGGLLDHLDELVVTAGGRVYLAKDARLAPERLGRMYPRLDDFRDVRRRVDPSGVFRSDLSRRLEL